MDDEDIDSPFGGDGSPPEPPVGGGALNTLGAAGATPAGGALNAVRGSLAMDLQNQFTSARDMRRQAYATAIEEARKNSGSFMERFMPYLALAGGIMAPTRTGSIGEAISNAMRTAGPLMQQSFTDQRERRGLIARLTGQAAEAEEKGVMDSARISELLTRQRAGADGFGRWGEMARAAGFTDLSTPQAQQFMRNMMLRSTQRRGGTTIIMPQQRAENAASTALGTRLGQGAGDSITRVQQLENDTPALLSTLDEAQRLIENGGPTGNLTPLISSIRSAAGSLGFSMGDEQFGRLSGVQQLEALRDFYTTRVAGNLARQTDRDLATQQGFIWSPTADRETNLLRVEFNRRMLGHNLNVARAQARAQEEALRAGRPAEYGEYLRRHLENLPPVFDDAYRRRLADIRARAERGEIRFEVPQGSPGSNQRTTGTRNALPPGIPEGSRLIRRQRGVGSVWQTPNGLVEISE